MIIRHPACGKSWTGAAREHCPVCCETFGGAKAGDMHRKGEPGARRCVAPAELGFRRDASGVWHRRFPSGGAL